MNFDQRKSMALDALFAFLDRYSIPRGLSEDGQADKLSAIADAFARLMPTDGDYAETIQKVFQRVGDTHISNSWPTQAEFVSAMPKGRPPEGRAAETFQADKLEQLRKRMDAGEPVSETAIWGSASSRLDAAKLEQYRAASVRAWGKTYRHGALKKMSERYGSIVEMYFREGAA